MEFLDLTGDEERVGVELTEVLVARLGVVGVLKVDGGNFDLVKALPHIDHAVSDTDRCELPEAVGMSGTFVVLLEGDDTAGGLRACQKVAVEQHVSLLVLSTSSTGDASLEESVKAANVKNLGGGICTALWISTMKPFPAWARAVHQCLSPSFTLVSF